MVSFDPLISKCAWKVPYTFFVILFLKDDVWFRYLSLNVIEAKPIYATVSWSDFISALYTIDLIKHFPIKGQLFFPLQL